MHSINLQPMSNIRLTVSTYYLNTANKWSELMKTIFVCIGVLILVLGVVAPDVDDTPNHKVDVESNSTVNASAHKIDVKDIEASLSGSDDFLANRELFIDAATNLIRTFGCTKKHFEDIGGFVRSTTVQQRYFIYCGDYNRIDLTILNDTDYSVKTKNGKSRTYQFEGGEDAPPEEIAAKIADLETKVRPIPASDFSANLDQYRQLLALDPTNKRYQSKVSHYEAKAEERLNVQSALTPQQNATVQCRKRLGKWLPQRVAKKIVKKSLKAPWSARFSNYRTQLEEAEQARCDYFITVDVDAKNSFGVMIRNTMTVVVTINPNTKIGKGKIVN